MRSLSRSMHSLDCITFAWKCDGTIKGLQAGTTAIKRTSQLHTIVRLRGEQLSNGLERSIDGVDVFHYSMNSLNQLQSLELIYEREWDGGMPFNLQWTVQRFCWSTQLQCGCAQLCVWVTLQRAGLAHILNSANFICRVRINDSSHAHHQMTLTRWNRLIINRTICLDTVRALCATSSRTYEWAAVCPTEHNAMGQRTYHFNCNHIWLL